MLEKKILLLREEGGGQGEGRGGGEGVGGGDGVGREISKLFLPGFLLNLPFHYLDTTDAAKLLKKTYFSGGLCLDVLMQSMPNLFVSG